MAFAMLPLLLAGVALAVPDEDGAMQVARYAYPLAPAPAAAPVARVEFEGEPDAFIRAWADRANLLVRQWWPIVWQMLATEHATPPKEFVLKFRRSLRQSGYRTTEGLFISMPWVSRHPDDFGMVIHEMTHAVQDYHNVAKENWWLVEGLADYIRYWKYEPERPRHAVDAKATYRDGYAVSGAFLAWIVWRYDHRAIHEIDAALRAGTYNDTVFKQITGKTLDELWPQFLSEKQ
jgi:hypothetical protein